MGAFGCICVGVALAFWMTSKKLEAQEWNAPIWPKTEWKRSTPEAQGIDSEYLVKALEFIREKKSRIHSLSIIRHGRMVFDANFWPYEGTSLHDMASATKSVTSSLVGIAVDRELIQDVKRPVIACFTRWNASNMDDWKRALTIEHLLMMNGGLHGVEPGETTLIRMVGSPDWIQFMLDLPMAGEPGKAFVYSSGGAHLLSGIIREATKKSALDFGQTALFNPIGISRAVWPADLQGNNYGWGDLRLHPHDMARFGYLYLRGGVWNGKQVIAKDWVAASTRMQSTPPPDVSGMERGYGYLWWIFPGFYNASGRGGQLITVWPEKDVVVVATGGGFNPGELLLKYIAPAVSDSPLSSNQAAADRLQELLKAALEPPKLEPVSPLPAFAQEISGKRYTLGPNWTAWRDFALVFDTPGEARFNLFWYGVPCAYRIGLDGSWRTGSGRYGLPAVATGAWKSESRFELALNEAGNINSWGMAFDFEGDSVSVQVKEGTGLPGFTVKGKR